MSVARSSRVQSARLMTGRSPVQSRSGHLLWVGPCNSIWFRFLYRSGTFGGMTFYWVQSDRRWPDWAFRFLAPLVTFASMVWERFWR